MLVRESNSGSINSRDLSRTDLAHMVQSLRKELKEQIEENKKLEKKVDGLTTVMDLVREYIGSLIYQNEVTDKILEILERVKEE